ncbi:hypothetical protein [Paraburkholderia azotifigens]|uniref:hypothetical protein n=1 Tax=Paraburkholderia azotifigens TaxID=2057004 RepID=UPI0038BDF808
MQELQTAVSNAFSNIVASGAIEKAIEEKLTKTITSLVNEELQSYSDFGKSLSAQVKSALQVDFSTLGLPGYNDLILKIIRSQVDQQTNASIASQVEEQMKELLSPAPSEMQLSELIAEFIESEHRNIGCSCDSPNRITLIIEDGTDNGRYPTLSEFYHIYFDKEPGKDKYDCAYRIAVNNDKVYSVQLDRKDPNKTLFVGPIYGFARRVFQLYAAGTKLIIDGDADSINTYYPGYDD